MFNWFGYRLLSDYLQHRADARLEAQLDRNQYNEASLIEIRVPLNMPYQVTASGFERCDGEIEYHGIHYKYVKRKIEDGQLVVLCLPNETKMRLQSARDDFFKLVNDLQRSSQNKNSSSSIKNPVTEYWQEQNNWCINEYVARHNHYTTYAFHLPNNPSIATPAQPPEC